MSENARRPLALLVAVLGVAVEAFGALNGSLALVLVGMLVALSSVCINDPLVNAIRARRRARSPYSSAP